MEPAFNRIEPNPPHLDPVKSQPPVRRRAFSFEIHRTPQQLSATTETANPPRQEQSLDPNLAADLTQLNQQNDSSNSQLINPTLENHVTETPIDIAACETQLKPIVEQIEQLYFEGPIVAGWLESFTSAADVMHQDLVEELPKQQLDVSVASEPVVNASHHASYHLCGLDTTGQKWCYPCPVEQLPSVSIAIARYQKLQQLLERKQYLETRLKELINATG